MRAATQAPPVAPTATMRSSLYLVTYQSVRQFHPLWSQEEIPAAVPKQAERLAQVHLAAVLVPAQPEALLA